MRSGRLRRRLVSIGALSVVALLTTATLPLWVPLAVAIDLVTGARRLPATRLLLFGWAWSLIEMAGLTGALWSFLRGRALDHPTQYRLMDWWASVLMRAMSTAMAIRPEVHGVEHIEPGRAIILCRHASLADSLFSAWAIRVIAGVNPRYVLKRELLGDPCLDVVGLRVPNHFVDRSAIDSSSDLAALEDLAGGLTEESVVVIFPEGTRANPRKRERALRSIAQGDPERAERLAGLRCLLPVRPSGTLALLRGAPQADLVFAWHTGFDGLDTFGGIYRRLRNGGEPAVFVATRVPRSEVPDGSVLEWLDERWLRMDAEVADRLGIGG
ncbi:MAG: 1-acyl-sn-glycerol-3-phosphate acyltransferase [Ilumatobacteraceae bacterium]